MEGDENRGPGYFDAKGNFISVAPVSEADTQSEVQEKGVEGMSFREVQTAISNLNIPLDELRDHLKRRRALYEEGKKMGMWDRVVPALIEKASYERTPALAGDAIERTADRWEETNYNIVGFEPRYEGMTRAAISGAALKMEYDSYHPHVGDEVWLRAHGHTPESVRKLGLRVQRENFLLMEVSLADRVADNATESDADSQMEALLRQLEVDNRNLKRYQQEQEGRHRRELERQRRIVDSEENKATGWSHLEGMNSEEQLKELLPVIENIENQKVDWFSDQYLRTEVLELKASSKYMKKEVMQEMNARLNIHTTSLLVDAAGGWLMKPREIQGHTIGQAILEAKTRNQLVDAETIRFALKDREDVLGIKTAWDYQETVNSPEKYLVFLQQIEQAYGNELEEEFGKAQMYDRDKPPSNFHCDGWGKRKIFVEEFMRWNIRETTGLNKKGVEKAIQLADNLATATLQKSKWNVDIAGNDQMAELLYFETWRDRKIKGREAAVAGPSLHWGQIGGIGDAWLSAKTDGENSGKALTANMILPNSLGELDGFVGLQVSKYLLLKEVFTSPGYKAGDVNLAFITSADKAIKAADLVRSNDDANRLGTRRVWLAAQLLEQALTDSSLGYDILALRELFVVLQKNLSGDGEPFVNKSEMEWVKKAIGYKELYAAYERRRGDDARLAESKKIRR